MDVSYLLFLQSDAPSGPSLEPEDPGPEGGEGERVGDDGENADPKPAPGADPNPSPNPMKPQPATPDANPIDPRVFREG